MTMEQQKLPNDEDYERNRRATNIFLLVAAIIIVGGGSEQPRIGRCSVAMTHFLRLCVPKIRFCNIGGEDRRESGMT